MPQLAMGRRTWRAGKMGTEYLSVTGLAAEVQAGVPLVLLAVGRIEAVRDDNEGSTPMCLPHFSGSPLLVLGPGKEEPIQGPGPGEDSEKHHASCPAPGPLCGSYSVWDFPLSQVLQCERL